MEEDVQAREKLALAVGESVLTAYLGKSGSQFQQPFGSVSKSQLDAAIFSGLVDAGYVSADESAFRVGVRLRVTPARAKNLTFGWMLRHADDSGLKPNAIKVDLDTSDDKTLVLIVDDAFSREALLAELRQRGLFPKRDIDAARLSVDAGRALDAFTDLFGGAWAEGLKTQYDQASEREKAKTRASERAPYLTEIFGALLSAGIGAGLKSYGLA